MGNMFGIGFAMFVAGTIIALVGLVFLIVGLVETNNRKRNRGLVLLAGGSLSLLASFALCSA